MRDATGGGRLRLATVVVAALAGGLLIGRGLDGPGDGLTRALCLAAGAGLAIAGLELLRR